MTNSKAARFLTSDMWYWRMRRYLAPGLRNAMYMYFDKLDEAVKPGIRWLDIGCGRQVFPPWIQNHLAIENRIVTRAGEFVGVDPDAESLANNKLPMVKHHGSADRIPEPDSSFDLITANMVFEHIEDPGRVLNEVNRLLKPGGTFLMHTPNALYPVTLAAAAVPFRLRQYITAWLERRPVITVYPTWYRVNRCSTIRKLASENGLDIVELKRTEDSPETIGLGPLVVFELSLIALTRTRLLNAMTSNLIVTFAKPAEPGSLAMPMHAEESPMHRQAPRQEAAA
ncbi:MAG: methyltransferase domain-containing protein [Planctomycetota bacterium]